MARRIYNMMTEDEVETTPKEVFTLRELNSDSQRILEKYEQMNRIHIQIEGEGVEFELKYNRNRNSSNNSSIGSSSSIPSTAPVDSRVITTRDIDRGSSGSSRRDEGTRDIGSSSNSRESIVSSNIIPEAAVTSK